MQTGALAAVVCAASLAAVPRALAGDPDLDGATIARVEVAGNRRVEADAVRAAVRSRAGGVLRPEVVPDDAGQPPPRAARMISRRSPSSAASVSLRTAAIRSASP